MSEGAVARGGGGDDADGSDPRAARPRVLVLTPMRFAAASIDRLASHVLELDYPKSLLSVGWLVPPHVPGDVDDTSPVARRVAQERLMPALRRVKVLEEPRHEDALAPAHASRHDVSFQYRRRVCVFSACARGARARAN